MNELYSSLASVYDGMYRTFIDYDDEFKFYGEILTVNQCHEILEVGCGTGNLAGRLIKAGFQYTGLDLSEEMLTIARRNYKSAEFIRGDMRDVNISKKYDAAIITGRTISYLLSNKDVNDALLNLNKQLSGPGIICFDCIDANKFIPQIRENEKVIHRASFDGKTFLRESFWKVNFNQSWAFDWRSVYFEERNGELIMIGEDTSTIRAFTKDEMMLFLRLAGFEVQEILNRPSYAFDTFVVIGKSMH